MNFINQAQYKADIGIYAITNVVNGNLYIGQTGECFQRRYWHHRWKLRNKQHDNGHLQAAFNKYGEDAFIFEVLEVVDDVSALDEREIAQIASHPNAYNILKGGGGRRGVPMNEHAKQIVGSKNREHMLGRKHTEETKRKMSEAHKGQPHTRYSVNTVINEDIARQIKKELMAGRKPMDIASELGINYRIVNNMLNADTWSCAMVDEWDEFRKQYPHSKRLKKQEVQAIMTQYQNGVSVAQLAQQYQRTEQVIQKLLDRHAA